MYSDLFCKVYNAFGWNYYPEIFGEQLLQWLQRNDLHPKTAMDLACGTGVLFPDYLKRGVESVTGIRIAIALRAPGTLPRSEGKAKRVIDRRER